jgi:signal transduction histidine kinase
MPLRSAVGSPLLELFIPRTWRGDPTLHRRARVYLLTHLFAAPLGLALTLYLYAIDPLRGPVLWIIAGLMAAFLVYPFVLRAVASLEVAALISVQHYTFVILFGSFHYGGVSSPFFVWLGLVPLAAAFFLGGDRRLRFLVLALSGSQIAVFYLIHLLVRPLAEHVPLWALSGLNIISVLCTCSFVAMMSLYYASLVAAQQLELQREVESHRVTEAQLRRAKEDAERADRAKSAFLANTSHELRTPLNAIIGFAEVIRSGVFGQVDNARYLEYLKDIHDSGRHLLRIINDILDLSKIEAGKAALDKEEKVELVQAIEASFRMVQPRAESSLISISLDLERNLPRVIGSERMLQQVFITLLTNAVKFTPAGGTVTLRAQCEADGSLVVAISDNGIGMSEEDIKIALSAFGQVDSDLARKYSGTGLGLPLSKAIVELHGGKLEIESWLKRGTIITVTLPRERVLPVEPPTQPAVAFAAAIGE